MPWVILLPADDTAPAERWELWLALDPDGRPNAAVWDGTWRARHEAPGTGPREGDIVGDGEGGWVIRIPPDDDAPPAARLAQGSAGLLPGSVVTLVGPGGAGADWRVVAITAPD